MGSGPGRSAQRPGCRWTQLGLATALLGLFAAGCQREQPTSPRRTAGGVARSSGALQLSQLTGRWRLALATRAGIVPFQIDIDPEEQPPVFIVNGAEQIPFRSVTLKGRRLRCAIDTRSARIEVDVDPSATRMVGVWTRRLRGSRAAVALFGARSDSSRFLPERATAGEQRGATAGEQRGATAGEQTRGPAQLGGRWRMTLGGHGEPIRRALAVIEQHRHQVTAELQTAVGSYRYLAGRVDRRRLRLSHFDGARAILVTARLQPGDRLAGALWTSDRYRARFEAHRQRPKQPPLFSDRYRGPPLVGADGTIHATFPDLDGTPHPLPEPSWRGHVVLVELFGTWCDQCKKQMPRLLALYHRHRRRGLRVVGIAFEERADPKRDRAAVRAYVERAKIDFPVRVSSAAALDRFPRDDLARVRSFPTAIVIGRGGIARHVHVGAVDGALEELGRTVERLLAAPAHRHDGPGSASSRDKGSQRASRATR